MRKKKNKKKTDSLHPLFVKAEDWKQPKCPSMVEWINKWWHIHAMEYDIEVKMSELKQPIPTQINLRKHYVGQKKQVGK